MTLSSGLDRPLHPRVGDIDAYLHDTSEPIRRKFEPRLRARAHAHKQYIDTFDAAYDDAMTTGDALPFETARNTAKAEALRTQQRRRISARRKNVEGRTRRASDRAALQEETASLSMKSRARKAKSSAPKIPRASSERAPQIDKKYIDIVGKCEKDGYRRLDALVFSKLEKHKKLRPYKLPLWDKTSFVLKAAGAMYAAQQQDAVTINLRLNPHKVITALNTTKGPAAYLCDRLTKSFKKHLQVETQFMFVIEADGTLEDQTPTFHLHGAVVSPDVPDADRLIDRALRDAAGNWDCSQGAGKQQWSRSLKEPVQWASYVMKSINLTARRLRGHTVAKVDPKKLCSMSLPLNQQARENWKAFRDTMPQPGKRA